jgi:hypothetical protein
VKKTRLVWLSFALIASAVSLGACGRAHLSSYYGQSYAAWFGAQHVNKKGANAEESRKIIESLDAQEAGSVSRSYRRNVARGDEGGSRLLMVGPRAGASQETYVPPPSVPQ